MTRRAATPQADQGAPLRLAYRVDELSQMFGVSSRTIYRAVADGRLKSSKRLGVRLIDAESAREMYQGG